MIIDPLTLPSALRIPRKVQNALRRYQGVQDQGMQRPADDIWVSHGPIALHTDSTAKGKITMGVILLNDGNYWLAIRDRLSSLPVGTVYALDGREPHGVLSPAPRTDVFAFLAWDVEPMPIDEFKLQAMERIREWGT